MNRILIHSIGTLALAASGAGLIAESCEDGNLAEHPVRKKKRKPVVMAALPHERQKPHQKSKSLRKMLSNKGRR